MPTRRRFLKQLAAASAVVLTAPYVSAADKSGRRLPRVGHGEHTYEWVSDWLQPPPDLIWGDTHGVCQDSQGFIYVAHTVHPSSRRGESVVVFDPQGRFVRAFGEAFRTGAHGLDVRREPEGEFLYHCDNIRSVVVKTTLEGDIVWSHGYPMEAPAYAERPIRFRPTNVAFAPDGDLFVGDGYGSSHVLRLSASGRFLGQVIGPGSADGQVRGPHGQWVDHRGGTPVLVVADRSNRRIQTFSLEGGHLRTIRDEQRLRMPCHFDVRGEWMVCPDLDSQVCILDRDYRVVAQLGDGQAVNGRVSSRRADPPGSFEPGTFITPHDAVFLHNGDLLVCEYLPFGRITLLRWVAG